MKKVISILLVFICGASLCSCSNSSSKEVETTESITEEITTDTKVTREEAETLAASALLKELRSFYGYSGDTYDISQTRYSVGSINKTSDGYIVNGVYYIYDKYGEYRFKNNFSVEIDGRHARVKEFR